MCGISAAITLDTKCRNQITGAFASDLLGTVERSLDTLQHRGPDARGIWMSNNSRVGTVVLGHVRLSINDPGPSGDQPFHSFKHDIHVVVNGEFYDYEFLRSELEIDYDFQSTSDSEVIIALYLKYGTHLFSKLRGEFAFVLYDGRKQIVLAARDRYGIKPLFWTTHQDKLLIASEAKAFIPYGVPMQWDVRSIVEDGWMHDERTLFKNVNKLRPGFFMVCLSFGHISHRQYWDLQYPQKNIQDSRSIEDQVLGLRSRLVDAVNVRVPADASVGIYLSGGIDSAIVAGIAKDFLSKKRGSSQACSRTPERKPLVCFGVGFEEKTEFDETSLAQETADFLELPYITRRVDEACLTENFAEATYHAEHHNPDFNFIAKFLLAELPKEHGYKVIISGEGSDEHFGGYAHFLPDFLREPDQSSSQSEMSPIERQKLVAQSELSLKPGYKGLDSRYNSCESELAKTMLNNTSIAAKLWTITLGHFAPWTTIYYGDINPQITRAFNPDGRVLELINKSWHPLHTSQYIWTKSILPNVILTCMGDRMEMGHSIEGRTPFLDHKLTEFVNCLPPSSKIKYDLETGVVTEKWILREAGRPFITDTMYRRKKHPFTAPNVYPVDGPLHRFLADLITEENVENLGFVNWLKCEDLLYKAFYQADPISLRFSLNLAQWVILGRKFGVERAQCLV